ncbi:uncharacterized protein LOC120850512 [Ixodes scapularis]|uniref:uncharacterized protein LOC120850512 n=1 Tax=Ixodes scapularis TaxID=6945 RepID=UPI001A9DE0CA|nr:uncharacterized protein LOC120850512 [Ixodes scapularis]
MNASDTRNTSTLLEWSTGEKSETMHGSSLTFSGYLLTVNSTHETIKSQLKPELTSYLLSGLIPWTGYNITLRRLYSSVDVWRNIRRTRLGRAATVTIKTEPSNPPAPKEIRVLANEEGKVVVQIVAPDFWNGSPFKYHIHWEAQDQERNLSGYRKVNVSSPWPSEKEWTTANLTLVPGVRYNVYVSAQNYIGPDVLLMGPELEEQVTTAPLGDIRAWQGFWSQFDCTIHQNETLSEIDKFKYLKSYLTGKAAAAIEGLAVIAENYEVAIDLLKERFGKQELIIESHLSRLLEIKPVHDSRNVTALRALYD